MDESDNLVLVENSGITLSKPVNLDKNPAAVYLMGLSTNAQRVQKDALNIIADILCPGSDYLSFPWHKLEYQHLSAVRAFLKEDYSISSINRMLSAARETIRQAWILEQIPAVRYLRIKEVKNVRGSRLPAGRYITPGEIKAILDVCIQDYSPGGFRDAAIIAWMVSGGGPRRSEVVSVNLSDYNPESGQIRLVGKGNKERTNYLENGAYDAMADWLMVRGDIPGPMFIPIDKGGNMLLRRMTSQAIYNMLNRRIEQASVKDFSPHDLRRTFISNMLDAGADLVTVSKIVGHEDLKTTAVYDRRPEIAKKKATQLLSAPYKRRLG